MPNDPRPEMARLCRLAYERRLFDSAGGNLSVRAAEGLYMTPRYAGERLLWRLEPDDLLLLDAHGNRLAGEGEVSREAAVHLACYRSFPAAGCVLHAHPLNGMVFAAAGRPIPANTEQTDDLGPVPVARHAPSHTPELAVNVVEALRPGAARLPDTPAAALVPRHGVFVVARDLPAAYDALERLDRAAYVALMGRLLGEE